MYSGDRIIAREEAVVCALTVGDGDRVAIGISHLADELILAADP
jgi:hypothetical protein